MRQVVQHGERAIRVDGFELLGSIRTDSACPECSNAVLVYLEDYDALCCPECNIWLEPACGEPDCPFCSIRPERPLPFE